MHSSSLFLRSSTTLISVISCCVATSLAATTTTSSTYALQTTYSGSNFFNGFSFFTDADPTHGFVSYVGQSTAQSMGLITAIDGSPVRIGVDYTNTYNGSANYYNINGVGRPSVRIVSNQVFNHGLFIADIANMPGGVCGTWPALWTLGPNWPHNGEIDIIEGVNTQSQDLTSLHTGNTCNVPGSSSVETGTLQTTNCTYDTNTGANSAGCGVLDGDTSSFGLGFNSMSGGVYAMEWTSNSIKTWFFRRSAIPSDITAGTPTPSGWGSPYADFEGNCNIDSNFANHQLIFDTTFCGDWAGNVWGDTCASSTGVSSCSVYVGNNPSAFKNMYWSINSVKVYGASNSATSTSTTSTSTSTTTSSKATTTTSTSTSTSSKAATTTSSSSTTLATSSSTSASTSTSSKAATTTSSSPTLATSTSTSSKTTTTSSSATTTSAPSSSTTTKSSTSTAISTTSPLKALRTTAATTTATTTTTSTTTAAFHKLATTSAASKRSAGRRRYLEQHRHGHGHAHEH